MFDCFNRKINYLRISVTDRCNFRCTYCMPEEGVAMLRHQDILSFDEIIQVVKASVELGIDKIRITGGEPLVRKGIVELVRMIASVDGIKDLSMTSNGSLLSKYAKQLVDAGLKRINISLDTINPDIFRNITRIGNFQDVFEGIMTAKSVGLNPIKINCVIDTNIEEEEAKKVAQFCNENNLEVRFIRKMDLKNGEFWKVHGGEGGDCSICNRIRLTANGKIKPCLFNNSEFDVRQLGAKNAIELAVLNKPANGTLNKNNHFNNIGG